MADMHTALGRAAGHAARWSGGSLAANVARQSSSLYPATERAAAQRLTGSGVSPARSARSAAAVMFRSMPPNTTP